MTSRIRDLLSGLRHDPQPEPHVHFHAGTDHHVPAACFDARCRVPRLDV